MIALIIITGIILYLLMGTVITGYLTAEDKLSDEGIMTVVFLSIVFWPPLCVVLLGFVPVFEYSRSCSIKRLERKREQERLLLKINNEIKEA